MSKVDKIVNKISQLKKDLKKIQDACSHKKQDIKFLSLNETVFDGFVEIVNYLKKTWLA